RAAARAEVDVAALLRDGGEARALAVQRLELGEDGVLGRSVDDERAVAALAPHARLDDALGARRSVAQDAAQALAGPPAGAEPVEAQDLGGGLRGNGHARHTLGTCPIRSTAS